MNRIHWNKKSHLSAVSVLPVPGPLPYVSQTSLSVSGEPPIPVKQYEQAVALALY